MDQYRVVGNPIQQSKSPTIHQAFAQQTQQSMQYQAQLVGLEDFQQDAGAFFADGGRGMNVTVPFKLDAWRFADQLTERAKRAGAVNTLAKQADGTVLGENTDGIGMVRDINHNLGWSITGRRVLLLGAGGAVRGVLEPLLQTNPTELIIANRTVSKAIDLANDFGDLGNIRGCGFSDLDALGSFDLIINGTSASLQGDLPPLPAQIVTADSACYDMMYSKDPTVFLRWGAKQGCQKLADGLGMLVEQAAESFALWRAVRPDTAELMTQLRNS